MSHVTDTIQKVGLAGASNICAATFTNPADIIKVRQQLQKSHHSTFWGRTLVDMVRNEGIGAIYKGLSASMLREGVYSGLRMGLYDLCKTALSAGLGRSVGGTHGSAESDHGLAVKLSAGMASGMIGAAVANPADLIKVRMQSAGATGTLRSHAHAIFDERGVRGLYRAVFPTTVRAGILTASQLGVYDHAKFTLLSEWPSTFQEGFATHFVASGFAGFACSMASNPVDVVKVRMMSEGGRGRGAFPTAAIVLRNEGPLAFYKGITMSFLRLWPHSVISLLIFEQLRKLTGHAPI